MFNISMFFYLFNCIKMNKNFLFLLFIILIVGIIVFVYNYKDINQKIKEFFEENYLDNFKFDNNYILNTIIPVNTNHNYTNSGTNYFEIKDFDLDGNKINNTIFTKFLLARTILNDELTEKHENFMISNDVVVEFDKIDKFLEIQFNFEDTTKFLKLTINSTGPTSEIINIKRNNKDTYEKTNTDKNIVGIIFNNKTMKKYDYIKKDYNIINVFYITLKYSNSKGIITIETTPDMITKLDDGLENHFCKDLLNVSVYSNSSKNITIKNNFLVEICIEKNEPKIKSKRTDNFDIVAYTHNSGRIFRPTINEQDKDKYASLGDYMYDEKNTAYRKVPAWKRGLMIFGAVLAGILTGGIAGVAIGAAIGAGGTEALEAKNKKRNNISYKNLRDALLLNIDGEYVIPAENVRFQWDDDFINLRNRGKGTNSDVPGELSYEKRKDPLLLFNLLPIQKGNFTYYPIGNYAYCGPIDNNLLRDFRWGRGRDTTIYEKHKNRMDNKNIPHVLVREDCIDFTPMVNHGPTMTWWDAGAPTPSSLDGSACSYWVKYVNFNQAQIDQADKIDSDNGGYRNSDVNNPGDFLAIFNTSHGMGGSTFNYQIKKDVLTRQPREYDIATKTSTILDKIKIAIQNISNITQSPIIKNNNVSPYFTQIDKDKTDSQLKYTTNVNFNNKMQNIQKDYNYNFSYITEINTQLSDIRQKEKIFVENQIKQQLETNKTKIQDDVKKQTEKLNKYDNDISQTSTTIGNKINEYVILRKQRELMPVNPQIMYS